MEKGRGEWKGEERETGRKRNGNGRAREEEEGREKWKGEEGESRERGERGREKGGTLKGGHESAFEVKKIAI